MHRRSVHGLFVSVGKPCHGGLRMKRLLGGIALAILVVFGFTASFQRPDSWISQGKPIPNTVGKFNPAGNGPSKPLDMLVPPPADASTFRSRWVFTGPVNWRTNPDG